MTNKRQTKREKFAAAQAKADSFRPVQQESVPGWWAFIPAILGFVVFANTLGHSFALDDYAAILENTSTRKGLESIGEIFKTSYRYGYLFIADDLYRPLPKALFAVMWEIWPENAAPGHWLNVLLFSFSCWLIYRFVYKWIPGHKGVALIAASLFAVHPIHTEVVANIKSLDEILGFLLGLCSLHLFMLYLYEGKILQIGGAMISLFLALCSKESSITFVALFPLFAWFVTEKTNKAWIRTSALMLVPVVVFLLIRYNILYSNPLFKPGAPSVADNMLMSAKDPLTRLTGAIAMLGYYGWKLLIPMGLSFDMSYPQLIPARLTDVQFICSAVIYAAFLVWAIVGVKRKEMISLAILAFFILVSVSSNIFVLIGTHYGERLMYAPSFAFVLLIALLLFRFIDKDYTGGNKIHPGVLAASAGIVLVFSGMTVARNPVWKNNGTLYLSGLESAPNSARVHYYEGLWLNKPDNIATFSPASRDSAATAGLSHLRKAVELYPPFSDAWTQLGVSYYRMQRMQEALSAYQEALKYNNVDPVTLNNMGSVYFSMNNFQEAMRLFQEAIRYKSDYADALLNIGSCYGATQQYESAIQYFQKAIAVDPKLKQAYYFLGITYRNMGNETLATQYLQKADSLK